MRTQLTPESLTATPLFTEEVAVQARPAAIRTHRLILEASGLAVLTFFSRLAFRSSPYFVDGPRHVAAILNGTNFIQPPGYFLYDFLAKLLTIALHIPPAAALSGMNIAFSVAGVIVFRLLAADIFPGSLGLALSVFYAFSDVAWFAADVHSTYAAMTFFAPLLLYMLVVRDNLWVGAIVWALMTGIRPSDGVFVLPFLLYSAYKKPANQIALAALAALPFVALWYIPSARHFGGSLTSPLQGASTQASYVAQGILVKGAPYLGAGEVVHFLFGCLDACNILLPFLLLGLLSERRWRNISALWMLPGCVFFSLYFFSDPVYLCYVLAPGLILAGLGLERFSPALAVRVLSIAVVLSLTQMLVLRPIHPKNTVEAVVNSYSLQYSGWALRHCYYKRLHTSLEELHQVKLAAQPSR